VTDHRNLEPLDERPQPVGVSLAFRRDRPAVEAGDRKGERGSLARPGIVGEKRDPDRRLGRQPWLNALDPLPRDDLDPASRFLDRGGQGRREVGGGS
jgi:hypothetical protein